MRITGTRPYVLLISNQSGNYSDRLSTRLRELLPLVELAFATSVELAFEQLNTLLTDDQEVAYLFIDSSAVADDTDIRLDALFDRWPQALRILWASDGGGIPPEMLASPKFFRVLECGIDTPAFERGVRTAEHHYTQQRALNEKSLILSELHRASMSLTGEVNLPTLLHKLMRIVIDNADAVNGYIILPNESGEWVIAAAGQQAQYDTKYNTSIVSDFSPVCPAIVDYCVEHLENVILTDAISDGFFSNHPYIRKNLCRSVMCSPMVHQGKVFGLLYLDNPKKANAFSPFSLHFLKLLTAPAAIALQNAMLYEQLETMVQARTAEITLQKEEIERQRDSIRLYHDDILSSLRYAKRIQEAVLPEREAIRSEFRDSLVFYRPKDVVSGDFYWFSNRLSKNILAAADCTGHGVPGAFVTIMANTLLKQVVELEGIFKPEEILQQLHLRIRVALRQGMAEGNNDGLDIALCQIDVRRNKLLFAGANRPLVIVRRNELIEIKGDKYGIGGDSGGDAESREFTCHTVELEPDDAVYLFSDGFADQIGGDSDKRYSIRRFYEFLQGLWSRDMAHQGMLLDSELKHWASGKEQTDDICILGFRV